MKATKHLLSKDRLANILPFLILSIVTFTVYAGTLRAQFVYDDHTQLVENAALRSLKNIPSFYADPAHTSGSMIFEEIYRPLRATVFAAGYQLWGLNPAGFHLVNIVLHLLNVLLLFTFLRWLLQSQLAAFGPALLFAVHPALTENVCWICSSSDLLCMSFFLLALVAFYRFRDGTGRKRSLYYMLALLSLSLSLFSKEMGVTFAAAVVAIDLWRDGFKRQTPRRWLEYAPFWIVTAGYLLFRATVMTQFAQRQAWGNTVLATAGIMARGIKYYVRLLVFPFNLTIIPGVSPWVPLWSMETVLSATLVLGLLLFGIILRRRFPILTLGIILFFILLLPVSNIVPIKAVVGDRFIYIPSLGFFIIIGAALRLLENFQSKRNPARAALAAGAIVLPFFLLSLNTIVRTIDWRDGFSLYKAAVEVDPDHPRPREMLAKEYFLRNDFEAARENCLAALKANPNSVDAHSILGTIYLEEGVLKQAEQEFRLALALEPKCADALTNLGIVYQRQGKLDEALKQFEIARATSPMVSEILNNIGSIHLKKGDHAASLEFFLKAFEIKPENWEAACNLAYALISLKRYEEAIKVVNVSLTKHPDDPELLALLGQAHSQSGNYSAAAEIFKYMLLKTPSDTKAALSLADTFMKMGQPFRAAEIYRQLLARFPETLRLHLHLASALEDAGEINAALKELRICAELEPGDSGLREKIADLTRQARIESSDRRSN